ncbi:MAG: TIM barrel protein [Sporomusaceae bacterium]|nr:TIM barrel protein [Sporomusaceae bacterium]
MLQLVNLSNFRTDLDLIENSAACLTDFLNRNGLDGIEMMFCAPWDAAVHAPDWIQGVHLQFWPSWLDFWRGDRAELQRQFGGDEQIIGCYGGLQRQDWLNRYRENLRLACQAEASYLVFHAGHTRLEEIFDWRFAASDAAVVEAVAEVVNALAADIPADVTLLFENLWWPGLRLLDRDLTERLFAAVKHPNCGIMLDTAHLMNTNQDLQTEDDAVDYILATLDSLGDCCRYIRGIHLNCSLSGEYVRQMLTRPRQQSFSYQEAVEHVLSIDRHQPFHSSRVRQIIDRVQPDWLVHEFVPASASDWQEKLSCQQRAAGLRR